MKKNPTIFLALLMTLAIVFTLGACNKDEDETTNTAVQTTTGETAVEGETTMTEVTTLEVDTTMTEVTTLESGTIIEGKTTTVDNETTNTASKPTTSREILLAYTEVMNFAKNAKPAFNKTEFQSLPKSDQNMDGWVIRAILPLAETFMTTEDEAGVENHQKGKDMYWFPVYEATKGCLLTNAAAIKSAKCDVLVSGNYKLTIVLNDEHNPEPYKERTVKAPSNTGNMFSPLSRADIDDTLINDSTVSKVAKNLKYDLKYFNCTAVLEYNPATKQIVKLDQNMSVFVDIQEGRVLGLKATGNAILYNTLKCWDFKY